MTPQTDNPANRPRTPIADEIRILASAALYHLEDGDSMDVREMLEEIEELAQRLHRLDDLVTALEWAVDWIDDASPLDPDSQEAIAEIRDLLAANPAGL